MMKKPISRPMHGVADYAYIPTVAIAPKLFGFENEPQAVLMCRALSGSVLVSSIFTRSEWGLIRVIPFKTHLVLDFFVSVAALSLPWLLGFARNKRARNTFLGIGAVGLMVGLLSQPVEMDEDPQRAQALLHKHTT